jgi:hypothetical protein
MSTPGPTPTGYPQTALAPPGSSAPPRTSEIKLISHSNLFYWWPVWSLAFFLAGWTYVEDSRLAILPPHSKFTQMKVEKDGAQALVGGQFTLTYDAGKHRDLDTALNGESGAAYMSDKGHEPFHMRISRHPALGVVFVILLVVTVVVTNVPLRGLWSFIVLLAVALLSVIISLVPGAWTGIFDAIGKLSIHLNMAGYLFIGVAILALWAVATFVFDRRAYVIFTPGQIKVCEHIGAAVEAFPTLGVSLTKQRDDLFRHYIFGFGSGDLILRFSTGDRREIRIQNVLGIGWQLKAVEDMLRTMPSSTN